MADYDQSSLFRETVGPVRRIKTNQVELRRPSPPPATTQRDADERAVLTDLLTHSWDPAQLETGEELSFLRPGVQLRVLRRLKRGQYSVGDEIDLHSMSADTARAVLEDFFNHARAQAYGCVKVIHGKGLRSKSGGPVLKKLVDHWLRRHPQVIAFASAKPNDGGTGAVYVLLKR